jgi:hypothetical protein
MYQDMYLRIILIDVLSLFVSSYNYVIPSRSMLQRKKLHVDIKTMH